MSNEKLLVGRKITIVSHYYPPETGAAANRMKFFTYWLHRHGAEITVITAMPSYPKGRIYKEYQGKVWSREITPWGRILRTWCYSSPARTASRRLVNYFTFMILSQRWIYYVKNSDVAIFSSGPMFSGMVAFLSAKLFGTKIILDARDLWPDRIWETGALRPPKLAAKYLHNYEQFMYRNSAMILAVTNGVRNAILHRVKNSIPVKLIRNCDQEIQDNTHILERVQKSDRITIVEAGTLGWAQSPETLVSSFSFLLASGAANIDLLVAGTGPKAEEIRKYTDRTPDVKYLGNLPSDKLWQVLSTADIGVATLKSTEHNKMTVSRRIYDYARAGLAIIYSGEGEGADILRESGAGMVVPPEDPKALAEAIKLLSSDKEILKKWKKRSRLLLEGALSPENIGSQFIRLVLYTCDK